MLPLSVGFVRVDLRGYGIVTFAASRVGAVIGLCASGPRARQLGELLELPHVPLVESPRSVDPHEHGGNGASRGAGEVIPAELVVDPGERAIGDEGDDRRPLPVAVLLRGLCEMDHGQCRQPQVRREELGCVILPGGAPDDLEQLPEPLQVLRSVTREPHARSADRRPLEAHRGGISNT